ncbi:hypothetical protein ES708_12233 [subsurface metagenome]
MGLKEYLNKAVVLDMDSHWFYIGTLKAIEEDCYLMENVDAHDLRETTTSRDNYLIGVKTHGLVINRKVVKVRKEKVIGISKLEDILEK